MTRITKHVLISTIALSITAGVVFAASVHFKNSTPVTATRYNGNLQLQVCGALSGLGNADVDIRVVANANPTATCTNPGNNGGNEAPGQNPAQVTVTGTQHFLANQIKNGNLSFCVVTDLPPQPTPAQAGCPNGSWTAQITCMAFTGFTLEVIQPSSTGTSVLGPTAFSVSGSASSCP